MCSIKMVIMVRTIINFQTSILTRSLGEVLQNCGSNTDKHRLKPSNLLNEAYEND